jgi:hypothetical protein
MSAHIVFVRVHEDDAVREIVAAARAIAEDYDVGTAEWVATFEKAVDLLAARVTLMPQPTMPMGALDLNGLRGRLG